MDVRVFPLLNTSIIAKLESEVDDYYIISDARVLTPQPNGQVALIPYPLGASRKQNVKLKKAAVLTAPCKPDSNLEKDYLQIVSGLVVANENIQRKLKEIKKPH